MFTLNCKGKLLIIDQPIVMGIINTSPDSFYTQSRQPEPGQAVEQASKMLAEGAAILDIGGQSTRPGAELVGPEMEMDSLLPVITAIHQKFPEAIISVDTFSATVATAAAQAGASIVNDVSGGTMDENMLSTVAGLGMPYICMHNNGVPAGKNPPPVYEDLLLAIIDFFIERVEACRKAGIKDLIIDPGFGFGKSMPENFELLRRLSELQMPGKPILLGVSRKSTIYKTLGITAGEALNGTTVLHTIGLQNGANILRVHDVREAMEVVKLVGEINGK